MADFLDNERGMMVQVKKWKDKVLQYDKFLNVKGLVEEFKEFVRPKSIRERMDEYSCAAEPPVQCSVSHLSRRSEPQ